MATAPHRTVMATPQWMLVHKALVPMEKNTEGQYARNARRRHRQAMQSALRKGFLQVLDEEMIVELQQQQQDEGGCDEGNPMELSKVLRITLSAGRRVQLLDEWALTCCTNLRVCNLSGGYLADISPLQSCINLLKLDLSDNQISSLPDSSFWSSFTSLRVLYLHGNQLSKRDNLLSLGMCPQLHILTAYNTPLYLDPSYRHVAVNCIYSLKALDVHIISDEEVIENLVLTKRYKSLTNNFRAKLYQPPLKGITYRDELCGVYRLLLHVTHCLAHHSPVLIIQRYVRGWLTRRSLVHSSNNEIRTLMEDRGCSFARQLSAEQILNRIKTSANRTTHSSFSTNLLVTTPASVPHPTRQSVRALGGGLPVPPPLPPPPPSTPAHSQFSLSLSSDHRVSCFSSPRHYRLPPLGHSWGGDEKMFGTQGEGIRVEIKFSKSSPDKKKVKRASKNKPSTGSLLSDKQQDTRINSADNTAAVVGDGEHLCIAGDSAKVDEVDRTVEYNMARRDAALQVRQAEKAIKERVSELRQPLVVDYSRVKPVTSKDTYTFNRAHATMSLSALKTLDKAHRNRQRAIQRAERVKHVARVKMEREERRERVQVHQQSVREAVIVWKEAEIRRLKQERIKQEKKAMEDLVDKNIAMDTAAERTERIRTEQKFVSEFCQHNTMVEKALFAEDRRAMAEAAADRVKQQVEEARENAAERQEIVKRYMLVREEQMRREMCAARKALNARVIQAASQRLLETKQKVAREVARRHASKMAMEVSSPAELLAQRHVAYDATTNLLDALPTDVFPCYSTGTSLSTDVKDMRQKLISVHMRRLSREACMTWQRSSAVLRPGELTSIHPHTTHWLSLADDDGSSPLTFSNLHPLPHLHQSFSTANHSNFSSPSSSPSPSHTNMLDWSSSPTWATGMVKDENATTMA